MPLFRWMASAFAAIAIVFSGASGAQEAPEAVYGKFHAAFIAGDFNEIRKWSTTDGGNQLASRPAAERQAMIAFMGGMTPKSYAVIAKDESGDKATLRLCARASEDGKVTTLPATIELVKERGAWKVLSENWGGAQPAVPATQPCPAPVEPARRVKFQ